MTKLQVFPFLKLNAITEPLDNLEFFIHGNTPYARSLSANSAIIFNLKVILTFQVWFQILKMLKPSQYVPEDVSKMPITLDHH